MLILVSGEGPKDMGRCVAGDPCSGDDFEPGPMAWMVDRITEGKQGYSFLGFQQMECVSEQEVSRVSKGLRPPSLPGRKRGIETAYYFRNARALARIAQELEERTNCGVVAVLFRDADGTQSAGRGHWQDKWNSMVEGFDYEGFNTGIPMLPKPKSEAWLLCALQGEPYQHCARIEDASGNDAAPNSLKAKLEEAMGEPPTAAQLSDLVREGRVDVMRIDMPSFLVFRDRLEQTLRNGTRQARP